MNRKEFEKKVESLRRRLDPKRVEQEKREARVRGIVRGLAVGTFIGGLAGVFFAPDKGKNTRKKTKEELERVKEILEVNFSEGKEKVLGAYQQQKEIVSEKVGLLKDKFEAPMKAINVVEEEDLELEEEQG